MSIQKFSSLPFPFRYIVIFFFLISITEHLAQIHLEKKENVL